jgi:hypothetical protein
VADVVAAVEGVDTVNRVALETPANNQPRILASDYEVLRIGTIVLNNNID